MVRNGWLTGLNYSVPTIKNITANSCISCRGYNHIDVIYFLKQIHKIFCTTKTKINVDRVSIMVFVLNTGTCGAPLDSTSERCIWPAATVWKKTTFSSLHVWLYESYGRKWLNRMDENGWIATQNHNCYLSIFTAFSNNSISQSESVTSSKYIL
jgi:hypothetical protein